MIEYRTECPTCNEGFVLQSESQAGHFSCKQRRDKLDKRLADEKCDAAINRGFKR